MGVEAADFLSLRWRRTLIGVLASRAVGCAHILYFPSRFGNFFGASIVPSRSDKRKRYSRFPPNPFLPSIFLWRLALLLLFGMLAWLALVLPIRPQTCALRYPFASHKGNAELSVRNCLLLAVAGCDPALPSDNLAAPQCRAALDGEIHAHEKFKGLSP